MRHIKNYALAKSILNNDRRKVEEEARKHYDKLKAAFGNPDCWDAEHNCYRLPGDHAVVRQADVESARRHAEVYGPKYWKWWEDRLKAADGAGKLVEINIRVEWKRSSMYGMNPTAEAWLCFEDAQYGKRSAYGREHASGCGYDKASAAVSGVLCFGIKKGDDEEARESKRKALASLDRFVIEHGEALWKKYAVSRTPFPHLSFDGKGMSTFTGLFRQIGYSSSGRAVKDYLIDFHESARSSDVYHVIRKDRI